MYKSQFKPSASAHDILQSGKIIGIGETPPQMVERVTQIIGEIDYGYTKSLSERNRFESALGEAMDQGLVVMSTPIMTNAGRYTDRPLTACTVPTADIRQGNERLIKQEIQTLHEQGMGTGFNLDELDDPVEMLRFLNKVAIESSESGKEDRPVGNMAVLSIYHPKINDFVKAKMDTNSQWKFNLSINIDEYFMNALSSDKSVTLWNGSTISSAQLFDQICQAAAHSGDPGLVFLDRMNARNPVPGLGEYKTTAPCAEVGLLEGETCQFGYINVAKFILIKNGIPQFDEAKLQGISSLMTRALDDTLDISRGRFVSEQSRYILDRKRKIGIGICGVADALLLAGYPYDSDEGRQLIQNMLATINYSTKEESVRLAEQRGSCLSMTDILSNRYLTPSGSQLERLYARYPTDNIKTKDWMVLADRIKKHRTLRNISTVALPPTGRSALVIDASTGIEPYFTLDRLNSSVVASIKSARKMHSNEHLEQLLSTASSIKPLGHIAMAASLQRFSDEALSKTINLPEGSSATDVADVYKIAHESNMCGVTIYIDGTHKLQPKKLK